MGFEILIFGFIFSDVIGCSKQGLSLEFLYFNFIGICFISGMKIVLSNNILNEAKVIRVSVNK